MLQEQKLIEKKAQEAKLGPVETSWVTLGGGAAANDALLSNSVDFIALGFGAYLRLWDKTNGQARAFWPLSEHPVMLNTNNPKVQTITDFTDQDRIALPAAKISLQSLVLQMATAKALGIANYDKFDKIQITAKHPDALIALVSGKSEFTAHFTMEPFNYHEHQYPGIRTILNGFDVLGGRGTYQVLATSEKFYTQNPELVKVVFAALQEVVAWIDANKEEAAKIYLAVTKEKIPLETLVGILKDPKAGFSDTPHKSTLFSDFLYEVKAIKTKPTWKDLYFPLVHDKNGD